MSNYNRMSADKVQKVSVVTGSSSGIEGTQIPSYNSTNGAYSLKTKGKQEYVCK
jgi:hypothetical protein